MKDVLEVGRFEELDVQYPAKFYTSLDDEAPLYAAGPFDAPRWGDAVVAYDAEEGNVFLLGKDYWDALKNMADQIWQDYFNEEISEKDLVCLDLDYDEDGELYQFAVTAEDEGRRYAFIATRDGERSLILCDEGAVFSGFALREPAPESIKRRLLEGLLEVYFEGVGA